MTTGHQSTKEKIFGLGFLRLYTKTSGSGKTKFCNPLLSEWGLLGPDPSLFPLSGDH